MPSHSVLRLAIAMLLLAAAVWIAITLGSPPHAALSAFALGLLALLVARPATPWQPPQATRSNGPVASDVINGLGDPILVVEGGTVRAANGAARRLLGRYVVGEDVLTAIAHPDAAALLSTNMTAISLPSVTLAGLGNDRQAWDMHVTAAPGGVRVIHLVDRTAGQAAEQMRVDFVANASHELRTPLAAILGYVETLREDPALDVETRGRFLRTVNDEARRMDALVTDLMSLSRIEAEKFRAPVERIDLGAIARSVAHDLRETRPGRGEDIVLEIESPSPVITGDQPQLFQLIHNLADNGLKYGRAGTPVTVKLWREREWVQISVSDIGEGIAEEHLPRLTERFYRIDSGRSRAVGGTGLGLAIVKHVVEHHRGRLSIASVLGEGTTISVALPAVIRP